MDLEEIKRGLRGEIKKRESEQYCTCETNIRQMCKDVLAKLEEQESVIAEKDKEIRHHKHKQCLAMARWCENAILGWMGHKESFSSHQRYVKVMLFTKWHKRWLAIAKKFKEAK